MNPRKVAPLTNTDYHITSRKGEFRNMQWNIRNSVDYFDESKKRENASKYRQQFKAFSFLFSIFSLIGIRIFQPQPGDYDPCMISQIWKILMTLIIVSAYVTSILLIHNFSPTTSMTLTFYAQSTFSVMMRIYILIRVKRVHKVASSICRLFSDFSSPFKGTSLKIIILEVILFLPFVVGVFGSLLKSLLELSYQNDRVQAFNISVLGYSLNDIVHQHDVLVIFIVSFDVTYTMSILTCGFCVLLCCNLYSVLSASMLNYGRYLKNRFERGKLSIELLTEGLEEFKRIVDIVSETNDVFSESVLFIYGAAVSFLLSAISMSLQSDVPLGTPLLIFIIDTGVMAVTVFLFVTHFASSIQKARDNLNTIITGCSHHAIRTMSNNTPLLVSFGLLLNNVQGSDIFLTAGDMFVINKQIILTTIGAMVTYGMILLQGT